MEATVGMFSWFSITDERNPLQTSREGAGPDIISRAEPEIADPPEHG